MSEKIRSAMRILVDAIMEERPNCILADVHIANGTITLSISEEDSVFVSSCKKDDPNGED